MSSQNKIEVTFTWEIPAKNASIILKTKEEKKYEMVKCSKRKFAYTTALPPGKYHYYFIIDNKRTIDATKPSEKITDDLYNVLNINTQNHNVIMTNKYGIDDQNSIENSIEMNKQFESIDHNPENHTHNKIKSIDSGNSFADSKVRNSEIRYRNEDISDFSNTFSMKKENLVHEIERSNNDLQTSNNSQNSIVIVYRFEDKFLIPMEVIKSELKDSNLIKLRNTSNKKEYIINKKDIFYQIADCNLFFNGPYGNMVEMKEINELGILKNIQMRLKINKTYMYINNIFLSFYYGIQWNDRDFFLSEFLTNRESKEAIIIKTISFNKGINREEGHERLIIRKYFEVNLSFNHWKYYKIIEQFLNIISIRMKYMLHLGFNENDTILVNFIPLMSSNLASSDLYSSSILYDKKPFKISKRSPGIPKDDIIAKSFSSLILKNNPNNKPLTNLFPNINQFLMNTQTKLLMSFKQLLERINLLSKYQNIIKLMVIAYTALNYNTIFKDVNSISFSIEGISEKNMIYYSNMIILIMIKYINYLVSEKLKNNGVVNGIKSNLMLFYNPTEFNDDDMLLNDVIKRRAIINTQGDFDKDSISKFYKYYLLENITTFDQNLSSMDGKLINLLENVFDLDFLSFLIQPGINSKKNIISNSFNYSYQLSLDIFGEREIESQTIKQVWSFDLGESFETFITNKEKISNFFQLTQLSDYTKLKQVGDPNLFFRSYSIKEFFSFFLPILSDIDKIYIKDKDYSIPLTNLISDIQTHQSFKEKYMITPYNIKINHRTFEIIMSLLKNLYEEHAMIIQARMKGKIMSELVSVFKKSAITLQVNWRRNLFSKYAKMTHDECINRIICKYKAKDPLLIMYIIKTQRQISLLENNKKNMNLNTVDSQCDSLSIKENEYIPKINKSTNNIRKKQPESKIHSLTHSTISKKSSIMNTSITKSEINSLKEKLSESREQYKELVNVIVEYEKKLENFIGLINSNQEVKDVLNKNGIEIK